MVPLLFGFCTHRQRESEMTRLLWTISLLLSLQCSFGKPNDKFLNYEIGVGSFMKWKLASAKPEISIRHVIDSADSNSRADGKFIVGDIIAAQYTGTKSRFGILLLGTVQKCGQKNFNSIE